MLISVCVCGLQGPRQISPLGTIKVYCIEYTLWRRYSGTSLERAENVLTTKLARCEDVTVPDHIGRSNVPSMS